MWEGGKRERMLLSIVGKYIVENKKRGSKRGHFTGKRIRKGDIS
jgi:hypothetical protein